MTSQKWDMSSESFWGREFGDWSFSQENNLLLSRSSHNLELHVHANKTYWISSHGLGSPKTLLRDCSLGGVRRNPGGGVRDSRNFISASTSPPSPKPQKSMYLPMCVDFEGRFQILAVTCTYSVSNFRYYNSPVNQIILLCKDNAGPKMS